MEPWTQPTTAPHQPDVADDPSIDERVPLVERGWMEDVPVRPSAVVSWGRRRDSLAIDAFTAAVVIFFVLFAVVFFPLLLLRTV
jgi:hypothetical protein